MQMMSEKLNLIGGNLMMFASYAGVNKMTDIMIETPARAEVQKYLLSEMQGGEVSHDIKNATGGGKNSIASLYDILDKTTDKLPISMQNVANPLYAWNAANGTNVDDLAYAIPSMANFGAQVINMTGSAERAETAMEKLSYAFNGQFHAVDQFGISEKSLEKHGFKKEWLGDTAHVRDFFDAVDEITGDATKSMNNFNGMKQSVSKDFARSGKKVWNNFLGPLATQGLRAFHETDQALGGIPTMALAVGASFVSVATTLTTVIGAAGTAVGSFAEVSAGLKYIRKNSGGIKGFFEALRGSSFNSLNRYGYGGMYGAMHGMGSVESPYLASIDGKVSGILANTSGTRLSPAGNKNFVNRKYGVTAESWETAGAAGAGSYYVANPSSTREKVKNANNLNKAKKQEKKLHEAINKQRNKELTNAKQSRFKVKSWYESRKINKKYDKQMTTVSKNLGLLNKRTSGVKGGFGKLASILTSGWFVGLTGLGAGLIAFKALSDSYNRSQSVRDATVNLSRAAGNLNNAITSSLGNLIGSIFYDNKVTGQTAFDEGVADAINHIADNVNIIAGHSKEQEEWDKKSESEKYGYTDTDTDAMKKVKKEMIESGLRDYNFKESIAGLVDPIFGTDTASKIKKSKWDYVNRVQKGEFGVGYDFWGNINQNGSGKLNVLKTEEAMTGVNWFTGDVNRDFANYLNSKVYKNAFSPYQSDVIDYPTSLLRYGDVGKNGMNVNTVNLQGNTVSIDRQSNGAGGDFFSTIISSIFNPNTYKKDATSTLANSGMSNVGSTDILSSLWASAKQNTQMESQQLTNDIQTNITSSISAMDLTTAGTTLGNNLTTSVENDLNNNPIDLSGFLSSIIQQLSSYNTEYSSAGHDGGDNYKTGFGNGIDGTSSLASSEASSILSALDISAEAYTKGQEAGNAFQEGFRSTGGADINSPGKAARSARDESLYILGFMNQSVAPIYNSAQRMGSSLADGFISTGTLSYSGVSIPAVKDSNTAEHMFKNNGGVNTYHLTQNVNIEKVDSKERAKEIAEYTVKMMKWNNETAGRSTEV